MSPVKIFLITPPKTYREKAIMGLKWTTPHIGLAYLSAYISKFGHDAKVFDLKFFPLKKFLREVRNGSPDIWGVTAFTEEFGAVARVLKMVKRLSPKTLTVLGGPHATALPGESLEVLAELDFCVHGEGELAFRELLETISSSGEYGDIGGISYRKGGEVLVNPAEPFMSNLDDLPFPAWEKFDLSHYTPFGASSRKRKLELPLLTHRGCPYRCVFCQKTMGDRARARSVENVIEEVKSNWERFGNNYISVVDETFTVDKKWVLEYCRRFREEGLHEKIAWSCLTRVNLVDEEIFRHLRLAGCRLVSFGIESGNERILKVIKKGITLDQARRAIALARKYRIMTHCGIIFGHPFETLETMKDSLRFILENRPDLVTFAILVPFPGTEVAEYCRTGFGGLKRIATGWLDYEHQMGHALELAQIPRKYLDLFQTYAYTRFFLHPRNFFNFFKLVNIRSIPRFLWAKIRGMLGRS
ncbi:MAG: B12-binding domain-containing radical SAM protein [Promethearchaeota archaeon]